MGGVLPDAAHAQLQQRKVVPGGDDDGEHGYISGRVAKGTRNSVRFGMIECAPI